MQTHYTATAKGDRLLELPPEAEALGIQPGAKIEIIVETAALGEPPVRRVSAAGKYKGLLSTEDFMRRKQEEIDWEDRRRS